MRKINYIVSFVTIILFFIACKPQNKQVQGDNMNTSGTSMSYAVGFKMEQKDGFKEIWVMNPWSSDAVFEHYILYKNENTVLPKSGVKIKIPLQSIATSSVTHLEFLSLLGEINHLSGVCNPELIYNEQVRKQVAANITANLGDSFSINIEKTLMLQPGAMMVSGYNNADANALRLAQAGIPVLYNNEWMERSLLGRAEWIKFVAAFFDKDAEADSIFSVIEQSYLGMRDKLSQAGEKPSLMSGSNFRGTWYMPSGDSYVGQLYKDAGASYFYENDTTAGSLPLNIETVLKNFSDADIWINCDFQTISDLLKEDSKHAFFKSVKNKQVYNFKKRILPDGANDYWESSVARPDLLLGDLIAILYPELMPNYEFFYTEKLQP